MENSNDMIDGVGTLTAERDDIEAVKYMGKFVNLSEAKKFVDDLEDAGKWPEGHEAIFTLTNGKQFMYGDTWEEVEGVV